uniref:Uncharacterized protein n=1 Tax=Sphaerodactylus townsendi TaxID=933632 RepID=A0ACB8GEW1_9SAUR
MALLLDQETYTLSFDTPLANVNLQRCSKGGKHLVHPPPLECPATPLPHPHHTPTGYVATFDNFTAGNYLLVEHEFLSPHINVTVTCGKREGLPLQSLPSHKYNKSCDWVFSEEQRKLTYLGCHSYGGRRAVGMTFALALQVLI